METEKKTVVFALSRNYFGLYWNERYLKGVVEAKDEPNYIYASNKEALMGLGKVDIVLFHGWERIQQFNIEQELILLFQIGATLVGERECVDDFVWNELKAHEKPYIPKYVAPPETVVSLTKYDFMEV